MAIYTSYKELKNKTLKFNDNVVFKVNNELYIYRVDCNFLNCTTHYNGIIFNKLGLNKDTFCETHYGYKPIDGDCPIYKNYDYKAATRLIMALFQECEKQNGETLNDISKTYVKGTQGSTILQIESKPCHGGVFKVVEQFYLAKIVHNKKVYKKRFKYADDAKKQLEVWRKEFNN